MVVWPWFEDLASFQWNQSVGPTAQYNFEPITTSNDVFTNGNKKAGYAGGTLALSFNPADASSDAVVWAVVSPPDTTAACPCAGYLLAYSLTPAGVLSSNPIWPSLPLPTTGYDFQAATFAIPTAVNGKVYVPTFGLADGSGGYTKSGIAV
jgi:hypothetical protein